MKKHLQITLSTLALSLVAFGAHAEAGKGMGPIDTNGDGKVTKAEADAASAAEFKVFDTNGDGKISADEFKATIYKINAKAFADDAAKKKAAPMIDARFKGLDTDKNSSVSKAEFMADATRRHKMLDENGDGTVTKAEVDSMQAKIKKQVEAAKAKQGK